MQDLYLLLKLLKAKSFRRPTLIPHFSAKERGREWVVGECWVAEDGEITGWAGSHPDTGQIQPKRKKTLAEWNEDVQIKQSRAGVGGAITLPLPGSAKTFGGIMSIFLWMTSSLSGNSFTFCKGRIST